VLNNKDPSLIRVQCIARLEYNITAANPWPVALLLGALAWNTDLLASGSRDRMIMLHDTRVVPVVPEKRLAGHRQEVSVVSRSLTLNHILCGILYAEFIVQF